MIRDYNFSLSYDGWRVIYTDSNEVQVNDITGPEIYAGGPFPTLEEALRCAYQMTAGYGPLVITVRRRI